MRLDVRLLVATTLLIATVAAAQQTTPDVPPAAPATADASGDDFAKAAFFGKKFFDLKEYTSAYEQFARADAVKPDDPAVLYDMALVLAKAGRYAEAQVKVDRYNQLFPAGAERPLVGKLQLELEFERELQKKRQADQDYVALFNRGTFLYGKGDLPAALQTFQEAEQQKPGDPAVIFNQGVIFEKMGELARASERFKRYSDIEPDATLKSSAGQRLFVIDNEIQDMRTKNVCSFCGLKLDEGATWCHRCWHGPYLTASAAWNTRPCVEGATATRSTYFSDNRLQKNDALSCLFRDGTMRESVRYSGIRQRAIRDARKAEGWTYDGELIQGWSDRQGSQIRYVQGQERLERVVSSSTGEYLDYEAHQTTEGSWLLDREDIVIDGQKYASRYTFDEKNRIAQQRVTYQNAAACNHLITTVGDYVYQNDALVAVNFKGGYEGYVAEGTPKTEWQATIAFSFDDQARVTKEELAITSMVKTYAQRPQGALRDELARLHIGMRPKRPVENILRSGDLCATAGTLLLGNPIDLRPFYAVSPNLDIVIPPGVVRAIVTFTYPESFKIR